MRKRTSQDIGKGFEKTLQGVFSSLSKTHGFAHHKLTDTAAAGGIVQAQPSDYLVHSGFGVAFLEAKASQTHTKMQMGLLRPAQRGAIKLWAQMLRCPYYIVFHSEKSGEVHILDGAEFTKSGARGYDRALLWSAPLDQLVVGMVRVFNLNPLPGILAEYRRYYE